MIVKSVGKLFVLSSLAIVTLFSCNKDKGGGNTPISGNTPIYYCDSTGSASKSQYSIDIELFSDQCNGILPYIKVSDYLNLYGDYSSKYSNNVFTFTNNRWKGTTFASNNKNEAYYNTIDHTITYKDYSTFVNYNPYDKTPLDAVAGKSIEDIFGIKCSYSNETYTPANEDLVVDLDNYKINHVIKNNNLYLPLYTVKTLFIYPLQPSLFYNGCGLFENILYQDDSYPYVRTIKSGLFTPNTDYLKYCYHQFGLDIDFKFGMNGGSSRTMRNNKNKFVYSCSINNSSLNNTSVLGGKENTMTSSVQNFVNGVWDVYRNYLDDGGHTVITSKTNYFNASPTTSHDKYGDEFLYLSNNHNRLRYYREKNQGTGGLSSLKNGTTTIRDTLFITFDEFSFEEYYDEDGKTLLKPLQTIIKEAIAKIKNNISIKHLVVDLSQNGGGYVAAADMLIYWLTRGNAICNAQSAVGLGNSKGSIQYKWDIDGDRYINDNDKLSDQITSIDLLCSKSSFSAANYTACQVAKYGTNVYIDGENTGGGVCCVDSSAINGLGMSTYMSNYIGLYIDGKSVDEGVTNFKSISSMNWPLNPNSPTDNYFHYVDYDYIQDIISSR